MAKSPDDMISAVIGSLADRTDVDDEMLRLVRLACDQNG